MSVYAEAGAWLGDMRRSVEITQAELAEMLLVESDDIAKAEAGVSIAQDILLDRAAPILGTSPEQLKQMYRARLDATKAAA